MIRGLRAAIVGVCCLYGSSAYGNAMLEIRTGLKRLHQVQDEIARGLSNAPQFQNAILERLTGIFETLPEASSADHEYQSALAELALGGGDRKRMATLIRHSHENGAIVPLLSGVEAYLEGDMEKAASTFEQIEASENGFAEIDHFLALAKGTALLDSNLPKAREAFERATLYAPGTLVEEVALRRLVRISLKQKDPALFVKCAILYIRRYANSPFAPEFLSSFADGVRLVTNAEDSARLGDLVTLLPAETGRNLLVQSAEGVLAEGKVDLARVFVSRMPSTETDRGTASTQLTVAKLLGMFVTMKKNPAPETLTLLHDVDPVLARSEIVGLVDIARHVTWNIHKPLAATAPEKIPAGETPSGASTEFVDVDQVLARARAMLDAAEMAKKGTP